MPVDQVYEYAVIRYVPRVEIEEFINVGVILFCKRLGFLELAVHLNLPRLLAFDPAADPAELAAYLRVWELICQGDPAGGPIACLDAPSRFRWLTAARSTVLQCSCVHPGRTSDPDRVLSGLFRQYVR
ncbi:DUF3037 domain-containing protein [Neolewinella lacunae]|uniref:DUF3037 domain-containing protein n=1 Tax=Neolewinella lacunae TaxID=1517758 RepID=A0A923TE30_9BACT|nr:DUF3037 domain-containing protein [Neolewinella lacunae]MBC6995472.1 DUF3037 domain-containing protein [Neolewinella lacunae]MDN3635060.1 DUF3037 domain-containing protein [Neolewinella lacunae]